jgi:hypothetical protein
MNEATEQEVDEEEMTMVELVSRRDRRDGTCVTALHTVELESKLHSPQSCCVCVFYVYYIEIPYGWHRLQ